MRRRHPFTQTQKNFSRGVITHENSYRKRLQKEVLSSCSFPPRWKLDEYKYLGYSGNGGLAHPASQYPHASNLGEISLIVARKWRWRGGRGRAEEGRSGDAFYRQRFVSSFLPPRKNESGTIYNLGALLSFLGQFLHCVKERTRGSGKGGRDSEGGKGGEGGI